MISSSSLRAGYPGPTHPNPGWWSRTAADDPVPGGPVAGPVPGVDVHDVAAGALRDAGRVAAGQDHGPVRDADDLGVEAGEAGRVGPVGEDRVATVEVGEVRAAVGPLERSAVQPPGQAGNREDRRVVRGGAAEALRIEGRDDGPPAAGEVRRADDRRDVLAHGKQRPPARAQREDVVLVAAPHLGEMQVEEAGEG